MPTTRKRLLFVEQNQDGTIGGSHHALLALLRRLDRRAFDPIVAFYEPHSLVADFREHARVVLLPSPRPIAIRRASGGGLSDPVGTAALGLRKAINLSRSFCAAATRVAQVVGQFRPHVIHLNNSVLTGVEWLIAARLAGARCVVHQRGYATPAGYARSFDRIICVSADVERRLLADSPALADRVVQIYDGIDVAAYRARALSGDVVKMRRELGATPDELLVGVIGNVKPWKGQEVLVRALAQLPATKPWRGIFVGAVPAGDAGSAYARHVQELARSLGIADRIMFTGYRSDVPAVVNALDIVVHTSIEPEPLGLVVLEGMAVSKAVIATDKGGPAETVENGVSGFLVPPGDAGALAAILDRLLESPELRRHTGTAGFERVSREFDISTHVAHIEDLYRSLSAERSAAVRAPAVAVDRNGQ